MKSYLSLFPKTVTVVLLATLCACSHIDEQDRLIYVKPEAAKRNVLLEDFTGQMCINCPTGTEVIEQLHEAYGSQLIAVGIHGGPLGVSETNTRYPGLATDAGNEYYDHWKLEYQPVGLVDRHGAVNYPDWIAKVKEEMAKTSAVEMELDAAVSGSTINISVKAESTDGSYAGKLQVWVTEDSITAAQRMPDGTMKRDYTHNHVLRATVNGLWGQDIVLAEGKSQTLTMTYNTDPRWNTTHLSIVAFVYNDSGVEQAVRAKVIAAN